MDRVAVLSSGSVRQGVGRRGRRRTETQAWPVHVGDALHVAWHGSKCSYVYGSADNQNLFREYELWREALDVTLQELAGDEYLHGTAEQGHGYEDFSNKGNVDVTTHGNVDGSSMEQGDGFHGEW